MKKILISVLICTIILTSITCSKQSSPSAPNVQQTVGAVLAATANANATQTQVIKLYSPTATPTSTLTPNMSQTVAAIVTSVGAVNATNTQIAMATQTYAASLFTPTITFTYTASPNETQTAAAIATIVAQQETAAAVLWTVTLTTTATATVMPTSTATSTPTIDYSALVTVPGGTFYQTDGTYGFSHSISNFLIGKYQVTYKLWYTVYQWAINNGYTFQNPGTEGNAGTAGAIPVTVNQPVTTVNWRDAIVWCNAYSIKSGLTPVYYSDAGLATLIKSSANGAYGNGVNTTAGSFDNPYVDWSVNGYRLPTEGEYQYTASYIDGSICTPFDYASGAADIYTDTAATEAVAWFTSNCSSTQAVGTLAANALGIYDMSGNVYEWCYDWWDFYPTTNQTNYSGPASGSLRIMRGGSFFRPANYMQVGYRDSLYPFETSYGYGFRVSSSN